MKKQEDLKLLIKLTFIQGLQEIVLKELGVFRVKIVRKSETEIYLDFFTDFIILKNLRSVLNVFVVIQDVKYNPFFIYNHKSILSNIIDIILTPKFKTFNIDCAGKNSPEILAIEKFIEEKYKLQDAEDADLEIYIGKTNNLWEIAIRATTRPLSVRDYKIKNIKGGMNATIAYTINSTIDLNLAKSYLNIFSGSATLPIEACGINPKMEIFGFDINKEHVSLSIQNIRKAGFIRNINLKVSDIFTNPNFGKFDVIVSDLPFGMQISKGEDLNKLYSHFIKYCEEFLNEEGKLVVYTSEFEILEKVLSLSKFKIIKTLNLKLPTSINSYLYPKIFVCEF